MTKKQTFLYAAVVSVLVNIAMIPVYKKRHEEEKKQEAELMQQVDEFAKGCLKEHAELKFKEMRGES